MDFDSCQIYFAVPDADQTSAVLAHEHRSKTYYASDQNYHKSYLNIDRIVAEADPDPCPDPSDPCQDPA